MTENGFLAGALFGRLVRGLVLGVLLSAAIVSAAGYNEDQNVFRYEGF